MNWILLIIAGAALLCPITMFGPALMERLGLRKRTGAGTTSCTGMNMRGAGTKPEADVDGLVARRDALDREIADLRASLAEPDRGTRRPGAIGR